MKRPPTIVFDLGGVLVENVTFDALSRLAPEPVETELLRERWLGSPSVRAFELGRCSAAEFADRFVGEWALTITPAEFLVEFATWPRAFWPESLALIEELRGAHTVACLSNCNEVHWTKFGGFAAEFDVALSSHLLGYVKPDCEIFMAAVQVLGVDYRDVVFFDDSPPSVRTARDLGVRAHLADGPDACRRVLAAEGLAAPPPT